MLVAHISPGRDVIRYVDDVAPMPDGWGCLPVTDIRPTPSADEVLDGPAITVTDTSVVRTWTVRPKTYAERLADVQRARAAAYPPIGDQLDAAFKARAGDLAPLAAIDAAIAAVKAQYPKPVSSQ